jgi:hypothetical protein
MRLYDEKHDQKLDDITLFLTTNEAKRLRAALETLLKEPQGNHHNRQRDVAASRPDVEDAQGGTVMASRSFGGQKTPDYPDAAEVTIDRLHEPVAGGG